MKISKCLRYYKNRVIIWLEREHSFTIGTYRRFRDLVQPLVEAALPLLIVFLLPAYLAADAIKDVETTWMKFLQANGTAVSVLFGLISVAFAALFNSRLQSKSNQTAVSIADVEKLYLAHAICTSILKFVNQSTTAFDADFVEFLVARNMRPPPTGTTADCLSLVLKLIDSSMVDRLIAAAGTNIFVSQPLTNLVISIEAARQAEAVGHSPEPVLNQIANASWWTLEACELALSAIHRQLGWPVPVFPTPKMKEFPLVI